MKDIDKKMEFFRQQIPMLLALLCAALGLFRALGSSQIDVQVLWFLLASGILLSLDRVVEFTLERVSQPFEGG